MLTLDDPVIKTEPLIISLFEANVMSTKILAPGMYGWQSSHILYEGIQLISYLENNVALHNFRMYMNRKYSLGMFAMNIPPKYTDGIFFINIQCKYTM